MRKFEQKIGMLLGCLLSMLMMFGGNVFGEEDNSPGFWNKLVAKGGTADWNNVFYAGNYGEDLYLMVYDKSFNGPEQDSKREIAKNLGFNEVELDAVLGGSVAAVRNRVRGNLSQDDALNYIADVQADYESLRDLYELSQEIEFEVMPSEMFSNGDLEDSGFDLIHDLELIEEVLFLEKEPVSVGGYYSEALDKPFIASLRNNDEFPVDRGDVAGISRLGLGLGLDEDGGDELGESYFLEGAFCSLDENKNNELQGALNDLKERNRVPVGRGNAGEDVVGGERNNGIGEGENALSSAISPAEGDQWLKQWCEGIEENEPYSDTRISSLGGVYDGQIAELGVPKAKVNQAICLSLRLQLERANAYLPGNTCILCEIRKINENLDKTLSHSLVPNKVTGNFLESAKCKDTGGALLNMQVVTVWSPVPTKTNDDLVYDKNVFEEFNAYVDQFKPVLLSEVPGLSSEDGEGFSPRVVSNNLVKNVKDLNQLELMNEIDRVSNKFEAEAIASLEMEGLGDVATNQMLYSREVLAEMQDMNSLFENFRDLFEKSGQEALAPLTRKKNLD